MELLQVYGSTAETEASVEFSPLVHTRTCNLHENTLRIADAIFRLQLSCGVAEEDSRIKDLFFRDPSKWRDYRHSNTNSNSKPTPKHPHFKHKVTGELLWLDSWGNPSWVHGELRSRGALPTTQIESFVASLRACTWKKDLARGTSIHHTAVHKGLLEKCSDALVTMYAKCGDLAKAKVLIDIYKSKDVITWTALIAGYAREGLGQLALDCLEQMQHEGILPDAVTYVSVLKACAMIGAADQGRQIHDEIVRQGLLQNHIELGGALVDMYAKCGNIVEAQRVLKELPSRDVVAWSALIAGYAQEGQAEQALNCLELMQHEGILPNAVTYVCALKACAMIRAVDRGKQIHNEIARQGLLWNHIVLGGALVDMYAKCGDVSEARRVLEGLPFRNVVSWNALIAGYAQEGEAEQALNCFPQMQCEGILPNAVTCASVLNVCSHLGLVEEGQAIFANMSTTYGVKPSLECYTCMIDLFGRAGHLEKAVRLIQEMPSSDFISVWHALLSACCKWADVNVGGWAFEQVIKLDKSDGAAYVLMANIYAAAGMEKKAKRIEAMRIRNKAWKKLGYGWLINSSNIAHEFSVGDTKHAQNHYIDGKLEDVCDKMSQQGYSSGLRWMSRNISTTSKLSSL